MRFARELKNTDTECLFQPETELVNGYRVPEFSLRVTQPHAVENVGQNNRLCTGVAETPDTIPPRKKCSLGNAHNRRPLPKGGVKSVSGGDHRRYGLAM